jgi:hypothetical protein
MLSACYEIWDMTAIHDTRWLAASGLLAAAVVASVVAGGLAGFLLAFMAVLLTVDRLLDLGGAAVTGGEQAWKRARRGSGRADLAYLADDTGWAAVATRRRLGCCTIELASIVGTTDRHKAVAFDSGFRPPEWSRGRWTQMYLAAERGTSFPPISVYRVDGRHYLRDGHHRVSVARATGATAIEATVVELRPA